MIFTPTASDSKNSTFPPSQATRNSIIGMLSSGKLLPTPRTSDVHGESTKRLGTNRGQLRGVSLLPTPIASDNRDRGNMSHPSVQRRVKLGKQVALGQRAGGALNPMWVEWLMGFPTRWTDSSASETPLFPK
jgi:hypothetical protein